MSGNIVQTNDHAPKKGLWEQNTFYFYLVLLQDKF